MFIGRMNMHTVTCASVTMHGWSCFLQLQSTMEYTFSEIIGPIHTPHCLFQVQLELDLGPFSPLSISSCPICLSGIYTSMTFTTSWPQGGVMTSRYMWARPLSCGVHSWNRSSDRLVTLQFWCMRDGLAALHIPRLLNCVRPPVRLVTLQNWCIRDGLDTLHVPRIDICVPSICPSCHASGLMY